MRETNITREVASVFQLSSKVVNRKSHKTGIDGRSAFDRHEQQLQAFPAVIENVKREPGILCKLLQAEYVLMSHITDLSVSIAIKNFGL